MSPFITDLLAKRGITDAQDIERFLAPNYERDTHDPFFILDMDRAVVRIFAAMQQNERIAVYADFDCDGIPGASILSDFFTKIGYTNFEIYLPHRDREGYGIHRGALETLKKNNVSLIITVDVGTVAVEPIAYATELGIDVIVTDHHEIVGTLPVCVAVLNPKLGEYPFPSLCGAGMAFKLVQALLIEGRKRELENFLAIPLGWEKWLLDLVAIATVADMVPLVGENRALVFWGLKVLRKSPRPGIMALCAELRLVQSNITEDDIGFSIAPRVNAASRMDTPEIALQLLTTTDTHEAEILAEKLEGLNASRKGVVSGIVRSARKRVAELFTDDVRVVVLGDTEWKPALLGLAANSIVQDRGGVVCLWGRDANGKLKGSCRSDGAISLADLFTHARAAFEECGGHAASGGFSVSHAQVHTLQASLTDALSLCVEGVGASRTKASDATITLGEVGLPMLRDIDQLAPYGMGNPKPIFRIPRTKVSGVKRFGKEKNHTEVVLVSPENGVSRRSFQFFVSPDDFTHTPIEGAEVDVLVTIERDTFRGPYALALRIVDITAGA